MWDKTRAMHARIDDAQVARSYIFRNRHRFFDIDSNVDDDIPAVRRLRVEVILIPWFFLATYLLIMLIMLWSE
jgi:hypothetical protein